MKWDPSEGCEMRSKCAKRDRDSCCFAFSGGEKREVIPPTSLYLERDSVVIFNVAVLFLTKHQPMPDANNIHPTKQHYSFTRTACAARLLANYLTVPIYVQLCTYVHRPAARALLVQQTAIRYFLQSTHNTYRLYLRISVYF